MSNVIFKTQNAVFEFSRKDVMEHLNNLKAENSTDEAVRLLKLISTDSGGKILIPKEHDYFGYAALDLIDAVTGSITCEACNKIYKADELKPITIGHGKNPYDVNLKMKGGIRNLFTSKQKMPAMFGGKGYQRPEGHNLIAIITWKT